MYCFRWFTPKFTIKLWTWILTLRVCNVAFLQNNPVFFFQLSLHPNIFDSIFLKRIEKGVPQSHRFHERCLKKLQIHKSQSDAKNLLMKSLKTPTPKILRNYPYTTSSRLNLFSFYFQFQFEQKITINYQSAPFEKDSQPDLISSLIAISKLKYFCQIIR